MAAKENKNILIAPDDVYPTEQEMSVRKVVASEFVSLDDVMEDPSWTSRFISDAREKFKFDELSASDALLLGRVTYEQFAAAWPRMAEQTGEYAP